MKRSVDSETLEIIASFIAEGHERLDDAEAQLEGLGGADDTLRLNSVFRLFHSVKGSAGYLGFEAIKSLTHEAESLLEFFIKGKAAVSPESLDLIYHTIDVLRRLMETVEKENSDESLAQAAGEQAALVRAGLEALRAASGGAPVAPGAGIAQATPAELKATPAELKAKPAELKATPAELKATPAELKATPAELKATPAELKAKPAELKAKPATFKATPAAGDGPSAGNAIVLSELVSADMVQRFLAESADLVDDVESRVLKLEASQDAPSDVNELFRAVHTIKGNSGFFGFARLEKLCQELESVLDQARQGKVPVNEALTNTVIGRIDSLRAAISTVEMVAEGAASGQAEAQAGEPLPEPDAGGRDRQPRQANEYRPLGEILVDMGAVKEDELQLALDAQERPIGQILLESGAVKDEEIQRALDIQKASGAAERSQVDEIQRREIRVDTAKLDKLFDLVGELITAEAMVYNSQDLRGLKLDNFAKAFSGLNKISREIQETTMMIRMIPLEGLFHKMTRLVRDLSRKFDKPLDFLVSGQETEMDKNVIEQISDPLVHILRNSIDHGIESPAERVRLGKPKLGAIRLDARYEGSEIWISVKDDGAGLNRERILAKAIEKGMIKAEGSEAIADKDLWPLIFEPGFSTAAAVTEVSGRGVGMDVVRKNLERIRGKVDINTTRGQGSEFVLKIPLTMAIIDGITLRAGSNYYSIPLGDILEFFKAGEGQITVTEKGGEVLNLRGTIMPLIKLGEAFQIEGAVDDPTKGTIIVVQSAGRRACVLIDEVVGNQQIVVKSLSEYLGKVEGISGCSILGDGTVSFIVDTARLIARKLD